MISYLVPMRPYGMEGGIMLIGGSIVLTWWKTLRLEYASLKWPRARGTIVSSEFVVDGTRYTGSMVSVAVGTGYYADNAIHKYRKGDEVDVSYDPVDPRRAMLQPGVYHDAYTFICIGTLLIACGACAMILGWGSGG